MDVGATDSPRRERARSAHIDARASTNSLERARAAGGSAVRGRDEEDYEMRRVSVRGRSQIGLGVLAGLLLVAAACSDRSIGSPAARTIPPAAGCTNPSFSGQPPVFGLEPRQVAAAYGIDKLWDAGYHGQGMRVALIEPGERLDLANFQAYSDCCDCWGPCEVPHEALVGGRTPAEVGGEPNFDSQVLLSIAPAIERLDLFESAAGGQDQYAALLAAALDPANTGRKLVDAISIS